MKERIDVLLTEKGFFTSREKARTALMAGLVFVDGQRVDKAGTKIDTVLNRIDNAINSLRTPDKIIITERFIHESYWKDISEKVGYSERTCQRMALEAMEKIVKNLFSKPEYEQGRLNFIFVDN